MAHSAILADIGSTAIISRGDEVAKMRMQIGRLGLRVLGQEMVARRAALLYCITPASIFM